MKSSSRAVLEAVLAESLAAVHGGRAVLQSVKSLAPGEIEIGGRPVPPSAGFWVAALGKAAVSMAEAFASTVGDRLRGGWAITGDAYSRPLPHPFILHQSGHPVPDQRGEAAAAGLIDWVAQLPEEDVLVVLLSGGASAMTSLPAPGLGLSELIETTRLLLASGADIHSMNAVRKHCSGIAGGRLGRAASCRRVELLAISDVPGDALPTIGSGPCTGDPTTFSDALAGVERLGLTARLPSGLLAYLEAGNRGEVPESPGPGDPSLAKVRPAIVARNADARRGAITAVEALGERALDLGEILTGEARTMGRRLAAMAGSVRSNAPLWLVAGGETVVTVRGNGRGGRSQELGLAAGLEWERNGAGRGMTMLAVGTDGADGPTDAAGAIVESGKGALGAASREYAQARLDANDSYGFFAQTEGLVRTGATDTNVMDLVLIRLDGSPHA